MPGHGVELRGGVLNALDAFVINHLNARDPFTREPILEPGRVVFGKLSVSF